MYQRNQWPLPRRGPWCKEIDDHCLTEGLNVKKENLDFTLEVSTKIAWMPNIGETYKNIVIADFSNFLTFSFFFFEMVFNDVVEYDGWHDVNMCMLYSMMKWIENTLFVFFIFPFFPPI